MLTICAIVLLYKNNSKYTVNKFNCDSIKQIMKLSTHKTDLQNLHLNCTESPQTHTL